MWKIYQFLCFWAWFVVKFYAELKKVYFMGSEMKPEVMRAQKSEQILIFEINKYYWQVFKYQTTIFNHLGLFMFIGSSIADTQHIFLLLVMCLVRFCVLQGFFCLLFIEFKRLEYKISNIIFKRSFAGSLIQYGHRSWMSAALSVSQYFQKTFMIEFYLGHRFGICLSPIIHPSNLSSHKISSICDIVTRQLIDIINSKGTHK
jgi:hypothetical protein